MSNRRDAPMDEDGTKAGMELLSLQEEPLGLNKDLPRQVKKRKGAQSGYKSCPKWWRPWQKTVQSKCPWE